MTDFSFDKNELPSQGETGPEDVPPADDVTSMNFEHALNELERIVQELERGELELDDAIAAYERGTALRRHCEAKLQEARLRVERITLGPQGDPRTEPMDVK